MRRLTLEQLAAEPGGVLPPDAVLFPATGVDKLAPQKKGGARPRRSQRFAVLNTFTDFDLAALTGAEVKVWLIIFRDTKASTGSARTGQSDIARRAGLSERGVRKAIRGLERRHLLTIRHRGRLNAGPSVYRVETGQGANLK